VEKTGGEIIQSSSFLAIKKKGITTVNKEWWGVKKEGKKLHTGA